MSLHYEALFCTLFQLSIMKYLLDLTGPAGKAQVCLYLAMNYNLLLNNVRFTEFCTLDLLA